MNAIKHKTNELAFVLLTLLVAVAWVESSRLVGAPDTHALAVYESEISMQHAAALELGDALRYAVVDASAETDVFTVVGFLAVVGAMVVF